MVNEPFTENIRVVPSEWPPLGMLPSEMKSVNESVDELLEEGTPAPSRPAATPSEAQKVRAQILANALKDAEEARALWASFIEWSEITDPAFSRFREILNEMDSAINTVGYRQSVL